MCDTHIVTLNNCHLLIFHSPFSFSLQWLSIFDQRLAAQNELSTNVSKNINGDGKNSPQETLYKWVTKIMTDDATSARGILVLIPPLDFHFLNHMVTTIPATISEHNMTLNLRRFGLLSPGKFILGRGK